MLISMGIIAPSIETWNLEACHPKNPSYIRVPEMCRRKPSIRPPVVAFHAVLVRAVHVDAAVREPDFQCLCVWIAGRYAWGGASLSTTGSFLRFPRMQSWGSRMFSWVRDMTNNNNDNDNT